MNEFRGGNSLNEFGCAVSIGTRCWAEGIDAKTTGKMFRNQKKLAIEKLCFFIITLLKTMYILMKTIFQCFFQMNELSKTDRGEIKNGLFFKIIVF